MVLNQKYQSIVDVVNARYNAEIDKERAKILNNNYNNAMIGKKNAENIMNNNKKNAMVGKNNTGNVKRFKLKLNRKKLKINNNISIANKKIKTNGNDNKKRKLSLNKNETNNNANQRIRKKRKLNYDIKQEQSVNDCSIKQEQNNAKQQPLVIPLLPSQRMQQNPEKKENSIANRVKLKHNANVKLNHEEIEICYDYRDEIYEVERIVSHYYNPMLQRNFYEIKWVGFPDTDNTLLDENGLKHAKETLLAYKKMKEML